AARQPQSGERMQPTAQAVGQKRREREPQRGERRNTSQLQWSKKPRTSLKRKEALKGHGFKPHRQTPQKNCHPERSERSRFRRHNPCPTPQTWLSKAKPPPPATSPT